MFTNSSDTPKLLDEFMIAHPELVLKDGDEYKQYNSQVLANSHWVAKGIAFSINKLKLDMELFLANADSVARLEEAIKNTKEKLFNGDFTLTDFERRLYSFQIIAYEKILHGDKPKD